MCSVNAVESKLLSQISRKILVIETMQLSAMDAPTSACTLDACLVVNVTDIGLLKEKVSRA